MKITSPITLLPSGLLDGPNLHAVSQLLLNGQCVVLPTDTGYMMAVDALDADAVRALFAMKHRALSNPVHAAVASLAQAESLVTFSATARHLAEHFLPGPFTIIAPKQDRVPELLVAGTGCLGIRIPETPLVIQLCAAIDRPLTATSTNLAGEPPIADVAEIVSCFGNALGAVVAKPAGVTFLKSSTLVRVIGDTIEILREGPVSREAIAAVADAK